jgi:hypothetical protein
MPSPRVLVGLLPLLAAIPQAAAQRGPRPSPRSAGEAPGYLYVWGTAVDTAATDSTARPLRRGVVLLTIDLRPGSPTRGQVTGALLADSAGRGAHHTEHALAADGMLFANDFATGTTHRFDLRAPGAPRLLGSFTTAGPLSFPHSYVRLPSGNLITTFQRRVRSGVSGPPGGIAELRRDGSVVRWTSAAAPGIDSLVLQPYSLEVIPALDRVVSTSTSMLGGSGVHVQLWRLSDLSLLRTIELPRATGEAAHADHAAMMADTAAEMHHLYPGEPRLLADGRTVMLGTFTCGLYRLTALQSATPRLEFVRAFPGQNCAVPVRLGHWWVQTVPALHALVSLDVTESARPREVSRLTFAGDVTPHWLSADASGRHLVMPDGSRASYRIFLATIDPATGALAADRELPVIALSRVRVAGLGVVAINPHGSIFGPAARQPR